MNWRGDRRSAIPLIVPLATCVAIGCERSMDAPPFVVRDSAGVRIAENSFDRGKGDGTWFVSAEPQLRIGGVERRGAEQFTRIGGVARIGRGEVVVLERTSNELRFFAPDGEHLRTVGGEGGGPGEFRAATEMMRISGDTVAVWDAGQQSVVMFASDGSYVGRQPLYRQQASPGITWSSCSAGRRLAFGASRLECVGEPGRTRPRGADPGEGINRSIGRLVVIDRTSMTLDTLGLFQGQASYILFVGDGAFTWLIHPFMPSGHVTSSLDGRLFYIARNPDYSIEVWATGGRLERIIRRSGARREPTAQEAGEAWDYAISRVDSQYRHRFVGRAFVDGPLPAIYGLAPGPDGELWVRRDPVEPVRSAPLYDVIDATGRFLGSVRLPNDLELFEVGTDYLLGVATDSLDVPRVEVYAVDRAPA